MRCVVGQPFAAGPWIPPDTASVSTIYIVIIKGRRVNTPQHLFEWAVGFPDVATSATLSGSI